MGKVEERIKELGLALPSAPAPIGNYLPWTRSASLVFISGQLPRKDGKIIYLGKVPKELSIDEAKESAKLCLLNALSVLKSAVGELDRVKQVVRLGCFVASEPDFFGQAEIANGASELLVEIFGGKGKHSRITAGVNALPGNASVELDLIVEVEE